MVSVIVLWAYFVEQERILNEKKYWTESRGFVNVALHTYTFTDTHTCTYYILRWTLFMDRIRNKRRT